MRPELRFLMACLANTCALLVAVTLPAPPILRTLIALPLLFVLPGEATLRALGLHLEPIARVPILVGMSMAMTLIGGLVLDCLGTLTPIGWVAWSGASAVLPAALARGSVNGVRLTVPIVKFRHVLMLAVTPAVLALTFLSTIHSTELYHPFRFTDFWMVSPDEGTGSYTIGIRNGEGRTETYSVRCMVNQNIEGEWQNLVLAPEQTLTLPVSFPPGASAQAWLFRTEQPGSVYRSVDVAGREGVGVIPADALGDGG